MKRFLRIFFLLFIAHQTLWANFSARTLTSPHYSWNVFEMRQLSFDVQVMGLVYETTVTFEIALTYDYQGRRPHSGEYEITWDFDLPEGAVITDCWMKPPYAGDFVAVQIVDLTTAEKMYDSYPHSPPKLLLRHRWYREWNGRLTKRFKMQFYPVTWNGRPVIRIRYLLPAQPRYNMRRITVPLNEFMTYRRNYPEILFKDHDNLNIKPGVVFKEYLYRDFIKSGDSWRAVLNENAYQRIFLVEAALESTNRSYLRIFKDESVQYYQLSLLPPVAVDDRKGKNILLAVDLTETDLVRNRSSLIQTYEQAVSLSTDIIDSLAMIYTGFVPELCDSDFEVASPDRIKALFSHLRARPAPHLNALPQLLQEAVRFFNQNNRSGEIWLLSNANSHSDPPATAMEIISQTLNLAKNPLSFRIINADAKWWPHQFINGQSYYGNDYLFENLARLSSGNHVRLRDHAYYDFLDVMLDAIAPTTTAVETDPQPSGGIAYSRFPLNDGRVNFPITLPYYEIGLFDGSDPFALNYYGMLDGELFTREAELSRAEDDAGWEVIKVFWFDRYIQNLLKEPQSFETIAYIEKVSVDERILTPYSGFIIPGPSGIAAFQRLDDDETTTGVETFAEDTAPLTGSLECGAYPNPFNASTTISVKLPENANDYEKITFKIFNYLGQQVCQETFSNGWSAEKTVFRWDGTNQNGLSVPSGVYLIALQHGSQIYTLRVTLVR